MPVQGSVLVRPMSSGFNIYRHLQEHGRNIEAIRTLQAKVAALEAAQVLDRGAINQARGGWRVLLLVGTIAGTLGALLTRVFYH